MQAAALKPRVVPRPPRPPRPPAEKLYCAFQKCIEDVQVHIFDIASGMYGLEGYLGTLSTMKYRQLTWSPFIVSGIPVTPLLNPKTGQSSFFIIRLLDSNNSRYQVDLLFRDLDLYFMGFRRHVVLDPEEEGQSSGAIGDAISREQRRKMSAKDATRAEAKAAKAQTKAGWGEWHQFDEVDMDLPSFFNAKNCGLKSSYTTEATAGGFETFKEILLVLGTFEDGNIQKERAQNACYNVIVMISEASRLRSVYKEVVSRIARNWSTAQKLDKELTVNINNWTQLGVQALDARLDGEMDLVTPLKPKFTEKFGLVEGRKHKLTTLGDLLDENTGELLLINSQEVKLGYTIAELLEIDHQAKRRRNGGPADRKEYDFVHEMV